MAYEEFQRHVNELNQTQSSSGEPIQLTPEQATQIWTKKVAGGANKGRVYELGLRHNLRRLQFGLRGIGTSTDVAFIDAAQLAQLSEQIRQLTRALAESEQK